jgi:UDP-N-acetyl-D-glucosamine dehydrogenase
VPTPLDEARNPDLSFVHAATDLIAQHVKSPALIVNESTSYPGTLRKEIAARITGVEHLYASSPERVDPGNSQWGTKNTPRLIGGMTPAAVAKAKEFYGTFCDLIIEVSSPEVAEAAKIFENTFRQVNIALVNEFAQIADALGISGREVIDAAATKPYGFMKFNPGPGVGGHCIPVDPLYLSDKARNMGVQTKFIDLADEINMQMPNFFVKVASERIGGLQGKKVLVIGVSYKPNVADVRETPVEALIFSLREEGAEVFWHDDLVNEWLGEKSSALSNNYDLAIVATLHDYLDLSKLGDVPVLNTKNSKL